MPKTVDGYDIIPGMKVWVVSKGDISRHTIKEIPSEFKLLYEEPDANGYIGCRIADRVFFDQFKAQARATADGHF